MTWLAAAVALAGVPGIDAGHVAALEAAGRTWRAGGRRVEPIGWFARHGAEVARIRVWTGDDGPSGLTEATTLALRAQDAGLDVVIVLFLSEGWADLVKQPRPKAWQGLDDDALAEVVEAYAARTTAHLLAAGVRVELVEIGNELDFGWLGVFEEEWPKRVSVPWLRSRVWSRIGPLVAAAERGVRSACPSARFTVHLARWSEPAAAVAFVEELRAAGATVDLVGLSWYPTSTDGPDRGFDALDRAVAEVHAGTGAPVWLAETGYPAGPVTDGPFADWDHPLPGYPLTPAGQRRWARELVAWAAATPHVASVVVWSPEWYPDPLWAPFAWFDERGRARPAARARLGPGARYGSE